MFNPTPPFVQPLAPGAGENGPVPPGVPTISGSVDAQSQIAQYQQYIALIERAMTASAGWEREKLAAQREDARRALDNAYKLAELQAQTSRYGTDAQRQTAIEQLRENARQFNARHDIEMQELGLKREELGLRRAQTATEFLSSPDRYAQAGRYLNLSARILAGQPGAPSYGTTGPDRPNTLGDFAVLQGGGNPYANRGDATQAAAAGGAGADARVKAITTLLKASPPSDSDGLDANDYAVLNASRAIMNMRLTPQQQAAISSTKEYQQILGSNLRASGVNADEWWRSQQRSRPGQQSARLA